MPESRNHRLYSLEVAPPSACWEDLAERIRIECKPSELILGERLQDASIDPPETSWTAIEKLLNSNAPARTANAKIFRISRWTAVAAIFVLILMAGIYFLLPESDRQPQQPVIGESKPSLVPERIPAKEAFKQSLPADQANNLKTGVRPVPNKSVAINSNNNEEAAGNYHSMMADDEPLNYADLFPGDYSIATTNISVNAPLLRDQSGDIILDAQLLTSGNSNYITVTAPNGQPARISSKFLPVLAYMNQQPADNEYMSLVVQESLFWKLTFDEWRQLLLKEVSLTPAAGNFSDILELKNILLQQ